MDKLNLDAKMDAYFNAYSKATNDVMKIKSSNTSHTRPDVAINQIEHGMALHRAELERIGIRVPYFKA